MIYFERLLPFYNDLVCSSDQENSAVCFEIRPTFNELKLEQRVHVILKYSTKFEPGLREKMAIMFW